MAVVEVRIDRRRYEVDCEPGSEARVLRMAAIVDGLVSDLAASSGGVIDDAQALVIAALLLADRAETAATEVAEADGVAAAVLALAERVERLAVRLSAEADLADHGGQG